MSVSVRRGAVGLALASALVAGLSPAVHADNVEADSLEGGVAALGNVCRGTTKNGSVGFTLNRNGGANSQAWGNSALVTVAPTTQPAPLALGTTAATTLSNWTTAGNDALVDAGDASVSLTVPSGAALGTRTASVTYAASGRGATAATTTRTADVTFSWTVVDCTPVDTTAPVISKELTPATPDGANGWYRTDVAVDWTVTDAESAVTLDGCQDAALTSDGSLTSSCSATSSGGSAGPVSVTVKRDATPPTLEPVVSGVLGEDGWYTGDVDVTWEAGDVTSGVDPATVCAPSTLAEDTEGQSFSCTVKDLAGNAATASVTVKRDAAAPVIVKKVSGTLGANGWYTSDVDVSFEVSDATSQLASTAGCDDVTLDEDSSGETYTCTATDGAGNSASAVVDVKRDATAPDVTFTRTGAKGTNGWYTGPVVLDWTVSDALSGLASTQGCVDRTVATDGRETFPCSAIDEAGNTASAEAAVDLDATAPVITPTVTGPTKGTEWFTGDVTVTWSVDDPTSGVATTSGCEEVAVTEDTAGTTYTCSATDAAGNTTSKGTTVKRDATAPVLTLTGGPAHGATYDFGDVPAPSTCAASDATSGLAGDCSVTAGGTAVSAERTQVATVTDQAGNVATETRTYAVAAWRLDGFYKPVTMGTAVVNTVKAGSTVPLKFNVLKGGTAMTSDIGASFSAKKVGCDGSDVLNAVEEFVTTGSTSLRYDAAGGQWVQNWATPAGGKGSCYRVTMTTADGSAISADFKLK
ncbi:PxKF domain-containing protein [Nocardioides ganghwensis]|uniref:Ig-like domain-containing protein n=1 Tax=Nocardioides ganghwensis TaxID=252230 RepID=A0A4Q2SG11_9ACTN|nr:PxKF domain-containing protein [Nocardioides ganghwensis]MBD3944638.1 PxKF domain-containing protein [Nocardioides ganghwensis]RYC04386.1 hypothetical protein EUA07_02595 [Nocardioides ganghwensis]